MPEKEKEERLQILQIAICRQSRVPDRDFEALRGAKSMTKFFLRILERDRGDEKTHDEVLFQPMGWTWVGEVARKRKK